MLNAERAPRGAAAVARRIADDSRFQYFIIGVIVVAAILIGVETSPALTRNYAGLIAAVEIAIQAVFVVEIAIRLLAYWPRPLAFFANGWNIFDFAVVAASLLPQAGAFAMVARLARL
ncbi:MAG TPA: ion transporter, partial [Vicinamibacterales bacterium]|nr:ion transporter [Vicinamibacterales bacterium]